MKRKPLSTNHVPGGPARTPKSTTNRNCARWVRSLVSTAAIGAVLLTTATAQGARKSTSFKPNQHGFHFSNSFNNDVLKELDIRTGGLCGGMVYSALDYYYSRAYSVPRQDFRPANRTPLQSYIYNRQVDSLKPNLTKWAEISINPGGARDNEFFRWGLTSELQNIKAKIDRGQPAPLRLKGHNRGDHQVLAIGYSTGARDSDYRLYIYDPNFPDQTVVMRPSMRDHYFCYEGKVDKKGKPTHTWRTYFVDKSYRAKSPLKMVNPTYRNDGQVRELVVEFNTGDDDLRGGNDNVNLVIHLKDGTRISHPNINRSARWLSNYTEYAQVKLARPIPKTSIKGFEFLTTFRGGISGDNWDAQRIAVWSNLGTSRARLTHRSNLFRFTGSKRNLMVAMPGTSAGAPLTKDAARGKITKLLVKIGTGGDDLRGNNDNLNITVLYRGGRNQLFTSVNDRKKWSDNSEHTVELALNRPVANRGDIVGVNLQTTSKGGFNGDNWNMKSIAIAPVKDGNKQAAYVDRSGKPLKRFTGSSNRYPVRW